MGGVETPGRVALVAGGSGGIGRAIVSRLRADGVRTVVWDIAPGLPDDADTIEIDLTDAPSVAAAARDLDAAFGRLDVLVNAAGYLGPYRPFVEIPPEEWQRVVEINLLAVMRVCREVLPIMRRHGAGRIVNLSSLAAKQGLPGLSVYGAASAGVVAFSKALAQELAATGIRVNSVAPGPIDTGLITGLGPDVVESMVASSPLGRLGTTAEVAELVVWLCSEAASFTTGAVFDVSGGRAAY